MKVENFRQRSCKADVTINYETTCESCSINPDEEFELCHGEIDFIETITVPWSAWNRHRQKNGEI
jgi:hypothetical protein